MREIVRRSTCRVLPSHLLILTLVFGRVLRPHLRDVILEVVGDVQLVEQISSTSFNGIRFAGFLAENAAHLADGSCHAIERFLVFLFLASERL